MSWSNTHPGTVECCTSAAEVLGVGDDLGVFVEPVELVEDDCHAAVLLNPLLKFGEEFVFSHEYSEVERLNRTGTRPRADHAVLFRARSHPRPCQRR